MASVSIITATYNRASTLHRAIDSVLNQTFDDFEYIIVDDGSTDNTSSVVRSYDDARINYIQLGENQGANAARNRGLDVATGDYISFLDSDDAYHPRRIEYSVSILSELSGKYGGVFHSYDIYDEQTLATTRCAPEGEVTITDLSKSNPIGGFLSVLFRAEAIENAGKLDENLQSKQDYDIYIRVAKEGYCFFGIDHVLGDYYRGGNSISADLDRRVAGQKRLKERHSDIIKGQAWAEELYGRALLCGHQGESQRARNNLLRAAYLNPTRLLYYYYLIFSIFGKRGFQVATRIKEKTKLILKKG